MGDDSPFLSIADFFSLIALTVIYIVIVFSPQSQISQTAVEAITGTATNVGPASPLQNKIAYVGLLPDGARVLIRVIHPEAGPVEERGISLSEEGYNSALAWLAMTLREGPAPTRVLFYLDGGESRAEANRLFLALVNATHRQFPVSIVFLDAGEVFSAQ
jgi:hypothetical protein